MVYPSVACDDPDDAGCNPRQDWRTEPGDLALVLDTLALRSGGEVIDMAHPERLRASFSISGRNGVCEAIEFFVPMEAFVEDALLTLGERLSQQDLLSRIRASAFIQDAWLDLIDILRPQRVEYVNEAVNFVHAVTTCFTEAGCCGIGELKIALEYTLNVGDRGLDLRLAEVINNAANGALNLTSALLNPEGQAGRYLLGDVVNHNQTHGPSEAIFDLALSEGLLNQLFFALASSGLIEVETDSLSLTAPIVPTVDTAPSLSPIAIHALGSHPEGGRITLGAPYARPSPHAAGPPRAGRPPCADAPDRRGRHDPDAYGLDPQRAKTADLYAPNGGAPWRR